MSRRIKKPKQSAKGQRYSYPVPENPPSLVGKPVFSFHYLQNAYCISQCSKDQKVGFADTMRILSKMSWNEIYSSPRHQRGSERIPRYRFKVPIPSCISDDETIISIRFHRNAPMVGIRRSDTLHIVWFDRNFTVYDHGS